jgi:hypothetical protein
MLYTFGGFQLDEERYELRRVGAAQAAELAEA